MFNTEDKYEICYYAWLEVKKWFGSVTAYAKLMGLPHSTVNDWFNSPGIEIPFEYLALTELITGVPIERLSPFTEHINKIMRRWQSERPVLTMFKIAGGAAINTSALEMSKTACQNFFRRRQ